MACHHLAKFGGHRYCGSRNVMFLVCHLIYQNHVIKGSDECIEAHRGKLQPVKFGGHRDSCGGIMAFVCHVALQNYVIKVFYEFLVKNPSR